MAKRYLILAEGFSGDPHYGKTTHGLVRYRRDDIVAILDSTRAGETMDGLPVVATVNDALCFNPNTALVGVATQGGRFPPAWRDLLRSAISRRGGAGSARSSCRPARRGSRSRGGASRSTP